MSIALLITVSIYENIPCRIRYFLHVKVSNRSVKLSTDCQVLEKTHEFSINLQTNLLKFYECFYVEPTLKRVALSLKLRAFPFVCKISIMLKFYLEKRTIIKK